MKYSTLLRTYDKRRSNIKERLFQIDHEAIFGQTQIRTPQLCWWRRTQDSYLRSACRNLVQAGKGRFVAPVDFHERAKGAV
jgi:hypothetical protein